MTRDEFFNALWGLVKDTDVGWEENFVGDEDEGEIYVKFKNIIDPTEASYKEMMMGKVKQTLIKDVDPEGASALLCHMSTVLEQNVLHDAMDHMVEHLREVVSEQLKDDDFEEITDQVERLMCAVKLRQKLLGQ